VKHFHPLERLGVAALAVMLLLMAGCQAGGGVRLHAAEQVPFTAAGIDEAGGVVRVTTFGAPTAGQVQLLEQGALRSQTYTSLQEAAYPWERTELPGMIVLGEEWVQRHGYSSSWAGQLHRMGIKLGRQPQVMVVKGSAEQFLQQPKAVIVAKQLLEQTRFSGVMKWSQDGHVPYEADLILPYLAVSSGAESVSVQAVVFKKQQLAVMLSPEESQLLACLQGVGKVPQLSVMHDAAPRQLGPVSCRTEVSGNGELKHPKLRIRLTLAPQREQVQAMDKTGWEHSIQTDAAALLTKLQDKQVDPLRLGETIRLQYRGYWSDDRWRKAYAHADVDIQAAITKSGGAGT
jgi:hypothetical protein